MPMLLNRGWIKRNRNQPSHQDMSYEVKFLNESHIKDIIKLQEIVIHNLKDREIFQVRSSHYLLSHLMMERSAIGVFTDDGLIAYSILHFPGDSEDNFGLDICLPTNELHDVVHLATVAVHPACRGNSLQKTMYAVSLDIAEKMGYVHASLQPTYCIL